MVSHDESAHLGVILPQEAHDLLRLGRLGERAKADEVEHDDRHLPPVRAQRVVDPAGDDQLGHGRREEALEPAETLGGLILHPVVKRLHPEHRAHARHERRALHRLGDVLVGAGVEPGHHVARVGERRHQDDRRERQRRVGLHTTAHLEPVESGHVDVEQHEIRPVLVHRLQPGLAVGGAHHGVAL